MKRTVSVIGIIFILAWNAYALNFDSDFYGSVSDFYNSIFGPDKNAGLTAFPILNIPLGGRSEGMAGAFSAVADDISFIEYNPAGSAGLFRSELALFHNNWIGDTKIEAIAYASRLNNLGFAGSLKWLYTPFTEYNLYGERVSKGYYSEGAAVLNISYNFFSGYYFSGISAGINLKAAFRIVPNFTDSDDLGNAQGSLISRSGLSQSAIMAMADIGVLTRFDFLKFYNSRERNFSAALVLKNLGPPSKGDPLPTTFVAGISYKPIRPLLFSLDLLIPMNFADIQLSEKPYFAFGFSAQFTSFLSMRMGILGRAGNVRITLGSAIDLNKISLDINYTLDLLTQMQPLNRVSLGVRFDLGDGGRERISTRVDELYLLGLDAYSLGEYDKALDYWEEALRLNPRFEPAREGISAIHGTQRFQQRIREMNTLN
ncbi:MAG: UPF0164 family protein [Treponema sp.]|jgi:tetratricopeptide (TPR) repeat protein|nr:UPF0164 family protein [Treponema sp.]